MEYDLGFFDADESVVEPPPTLIGLFQVLEVIVLIPFLITLLVCQLIGEITVMSFGLSLPGPVIGMAVLFSWLFLTGKSTENFELLSNQLLSHLSLLFVPAGVGVMLHAELLESELVPIIVALVISTLITLALTAWIMNKLGSERTKP